MARELRKENSILTVKNMLKEKLPYDIISRVSGLSIENIQKIQNQEQSWFLTLWNMLKRYYNGDSLKKHELIFAGVNDGKNRRHERTYKKGRWQKIKRKVRWNDAIYIR